jgi:predicted MPP superfamily phosphohydrolase
MATLDALLSSGSVARWSYHLGLHGRLRITRQDILLRQTGILPAPLVIAFASDFHAGPTTHPTLFLTLFEELNARKPDVLLLGGDYVSSRSDDIRVLLNSLARFNPPLGKYAVLGNHDLWSDDEFIARALRGAGATVLINDNCSLPAPYDHVSVCGIDDPWTGVSDAAKCFKSPGPVRIFLTHAPEGLLLVGQELFDVAFAGHTHGGQVALPDGSAIISAGGPLARTYGRGRFELAGGPLIVSRGVGCSNIPIRINSDPELIVCTLRS